MYTHTSALHACIPTCIHADVSPHGMMFAAYVSGAFGRRTTRCFLHSLTDVLLLHRAITYTYYSILNHTL